MMDEEMVIPPIYRRTGLIRVDGVEDVVNLGRIKGKEILLGGNLTSLRFCLGHIGIAAAMT